MGFYIYRFISVAREALSTPTTEIRGRYLAGMFAVTFGAMLQPQVLSFGDAFSVTVLLLLLAAPGSERAGSAHAAELALTRRTTTSRSRAIRDNARYVR
ncbi:hypothetical protein GCM10011341_38550 [Frigidibacter albus]|nr:hypothetical protein GCM10011341_38550 [Frigidibacter albus]